jgi:hypothetical protein
MIRLVPYLMIGVLVSGGVLHGLWTDRWVPSADIKVAEAGELLKQIPSRIDNWEGTVVSWPEVDEKERVETNVVRQYVNQANGNSVGVLFSCGHSRNVALFHTPDQCYPAAGYTLAAPTRIYEVSLEGGATAAFHVSDFKRQQGPLTQYVRVFWSWSGDGTWYVPDQPRLAFGRHRVLYKLYVTSPLASLDDPIDTDPCVAFIRDVIPAFRETVFEK